MFQGCEGGGGWGGGAGREWGRVRVNAWGWASCHLSAHFPHTETLSLILLPSLGSA